MRVTSSGFSTWPKYRHFPTLLLDGSLRGDHEPLDLGRPGHCKANLLVRPLGNILRLRANVSSAGECCDDCSVTLGCEAWVVDDGKCSLLTNVSSQHKACEECISGQSHTGSERQQGTSKIVV